jgi:hypothetical protein
MKKNFFQKYLPITLLILIIIAIVGVIVFGFFSHSASAAWYNTGGTWLYRKPIIIDHTKVVGTASSTTFSTASSVSWTVPTGVTSINVKAWGAGGGGGGGGGTGTGATGGGGGYAFSTITVTAGETLTVDVGGGGGGASSGCLAGTGAGSAGAGSTGPGGTGANPSSSGCSGPGGGGGGGTFVKRSSTILIAAAGGGGGGGTESGGGPGAGGAGGVNGANSTGGCTATGGTAGASGTSAGISGTQPIPDSSAGGGGGGGYLGGGAGGNPSCDSVGAAGGGGGTNFGDTTMNGSGTTPANNGDSAYTGSVGVGGGAQTAGNNGYVNISYSTGLSSFPVLVSVTDPDLKTVTFGGKVGKDDGSDIIFTDSTGNTLSNYEIDSYASTTGQLVAWINVSSLSPSVDTTLYEYFGNASASAESSGNITGTWDSNYTGMWHFGNGTTLNLNDSTSNGNNGVSYAAHAAAGQIGGGVQGNASNQYVDITGMSSITYPQITIQAWVYTGASYYESGGARYIANSHTDVDNNGFQIIGASGSSGGMQCQIGNGSSDTIVTPSVSLLTNTWYLWTCVYNGSTVTVYGNGTSAGSASQSGSITASGYDVNFMRDPGAFGYTSLPMDNINISNTARSAGWIGTEYNNQYSPSTFYSYGALGVQNRAAVTAGVNVASRGSSSVGWYNTGGTWLYRKQITIDHTKVATSSSLTSFPVLISVTDPDLKNDALSSGNDIIFTDSTGNTLSNYEIEKYDSTTGTLIAWVKIASLSGTIDTTLYEYFGNASASAESSGNITGTWDTNYKGVYHLPNGTSLSVNDSTSNTNNGTNSGGSAGTGKIDGGIDFTGGGNTSLPRSIQDDFTISSWFNTTNGTGANNQQWYSNPSFVDGEMCGVVNDFGTAISGGNVQFGVGNPDTTITSPSTYNDGNWHYMSATRVKSTGAMILYVDGVQVATGNNGNTNSLTAPTNLYLSSNNCSGNAFGGKMDEVRLSGTVRGPDWITTEYNNQNSPATFYSYTALQAQTRQSSSGSSVPAVKVRGGVKTR